MTLAKMRTSELRSIRHMTQATLAKRAQLSKTTISNLESGSQTKIGLDTVVKLCQALNCTPSDLFEFSETPQDKLLKRQKKALMPFLCSLEYSSSFDPKKLDSDLAKISDRKKVRRRFKA